VGLLLLAVSSVSAQSLQWLGEAPFCSATAAQCEKAGMTFVRAHPSGNGEACLVGTKVLCQSDGPAVDANLKACPTNARSLSAPLRCLCAANVTRYGNIWGSGPYTNDSSVCGAATHAGVIGKNGGAIVVKPAPGRSAYQGSRANGITTRKYGKWPASFNVTSASARR
jgi:hypothetical protein